MLSPSELAMLKSIAKANGITMSAVVRAIVRGDFKPNVRREA